MNDSEENIEQSFEQELYDALKFYGYLFPENKLEISIFDQLQGNTEIQTPSLETLLAKNEQVKNSERLDLNFRMAAFSDTENQLPDFLSQGSNSPFSDESEDQPKKD